MLYLCSIREYSALHTFASGAKGQAFELQEMGAAEIMGRLGTVQRARCRKLAGVALRWLQRAVT